MAGDIKTKPSDASVDDYIAALPDARRQDEARRLLVLYGRVTGEEPVMWGPSIIGYGQYHYKYESGREGDMCRSGFSPRKASLSIYLMSGYSNPDTQARMDALRARLGPHKTGASCLYITRLDKVDEAVLEEMVHLDRDWMDVIYPA